MYQVTFKQGKRGKERRLYSTFATIGKAMQAAENAIYAACMRKFGFCAVCPESFFCAWSYRVTVRPVLSFQAPITFTVTISPTTDGVTA